jgi:hypothetical protein
MAEFYDNVWNKHYEKLVEFKRKNGHCLVPRRYQEDVSLGNWAHTQRHFHSNNTIRPDRKDLLDEIGFSWKVRVASDKNWHIEYEKLVEFKQKNGHCLVPQKYEEDPSLGTWVNRQRHFHSNNTIQLDRKDLLDEIGFVWEVRATAGNYKKETDETWRKQYEKLVEFKQKHGHCIVPQRHKEDMVLGKWVNRQRQFHSNNTIQLDRKELLEELGFVWEARARAGKTDETWRKQYEKLVEFKQKHGNCIVPTMHQEDVSLGKWVSNQRHFHTKNTLRLDRQELLEELGFVWEARARAGKTDETWRKQYEKLVEFKQKHGNCIVPTMHQEDVSLGKWVSRQRTRHVNNTLRLDRQELLDEIGFVWRVDKYALWHLQYEKLVEFKQKNGHCLVPRTYQEDLCLGEWVSGQRGRHRNNKMPQDRKEVLDEIGFVWKVDTRAARSSTTDVSCRRCIVSPFIQVIFLTLVVFFCLTCGC